MTTYIKKDFASPNGPILLLSAKGSTTTSITQANGVKDFSGNGNHGQAYGGVTVLDGECFFFDRGTNSYILGHNISVSSPMTFCFRTKISSTDSSLEHAIFDTRVSSKGILFGIMANGVMMASQRTSTAWYVTTDSNTFPYDKENFVVVVFDSDKTLFYLDGVLVKEASDYVTLQENQPLNIGRYTVRNDLNLKGYLKDFRIYHRALSAAEVKYIYNGFQPNLIMGQTIPSGAILDLSARGLTTAGIAQANGVVDRSGNGNHGQAYNGVAVVNDDETGSCFSFDGTAVKTMTFSNTYPISTNAITLAVKMRHLGRGGGGDGYNAIFGNNMVLCYSPAGSICLQLKNNSSGSAYRIDTVNNATLIDGNIHSLIGIMYIENNTCYLQTYVDGVLQTPNRTSGSSSQSTLFNGMGNVLIGELTASTAYKSNIQLADIRIYPRALTTSEVQQLADASLKKITNIKSGSSDVRQIFSNGEMIYAKTNDYSLNL